MNLEAVYFISQVVGSVAIIGSLIFVGIQARQLIAQTKHLAEQNEHANRMAEQAHKVELGNAQRDLLKQLREHHRLYMKDKETFDAIRTCYEDYDNATPYQRGTFAQYGWDILHIFEQYFFQFRAGLIEQSSFEGMTVAVLSIIKTEGGGRWFADAQKLMSAEVAEHLLMRLEKGGDTLPEIYEFFPHFSMSRDRKSPSASVNVKAKIAAAESTET